MTDSTLPRKRQAQGTFSTAAIARQYRRWIGSPWGEIPGWLRFLHSLGTALVIPAYGPIIPPFMGSGFGARILFYLVVAIPSALGAGIAWRATHNDEADEREVQRCSYCHQELGTGPDWCYRCGAWRANPLDPAWREPGPVSHDQHSLIRR